MIEERPYGLEERPDYITRDLRSATLEERPYGLEVRGWRSGPPQADLEEGCDVGQGLVPCLSDSATHKGLPYVL